MDFFQSIILGIVQGFTEFLPVSSSGHLAFFQSLFGVSEVPIFYDVMLHVGTLVAVFIVLRKDIWGLLRHPIKNKLGMVILATLPAIVVVLIAEQVFPEVFADVLSGKYLAFGFFATSGILVLSEFLARRKEKKQSILLPQAMVMGLMQAAALVPGISRSGSTIAGGLFCGLNREKVARFAFIMSIPAILGGLVFGLADVAEHGMGDVSVPVIIAGVITSALCGFIAIRFMLRLISKHKLYGFAIYTAALGVFILIQTLALENPAFASVNFMA